MLKRQLHPQHLSQCPCLFTWGEMCMCGAFNLPNSSIFLFCFVLITVEFVLWGVLVGFIFVLLL